jgi:2-amino-4-hydroxy-6-hydroxymethyldihydropteridine diphosphokinase
VTEAAPTEGDRASRRVYLGLGSNLGDRTAQLRDALDALRLGGVAIDTVSALYETPPWGVTDQPAFLNAAASGETTLEATAILELAKRIEADAGRDFDAPRWTQRPLDIDILLIEGETVASELLTVPHALMHERGFVLIPLADIASEVLHPLEHRTIAELEAALPGSERVDVIEVADAGWYGLER